MERERVLVVAGGSQGEPLSALRRLSQGTHPDFEVEKGDVVILSARVIPGNERAVHTMLGDFTRMGTEVVTRRERPRVHTSGHASRSELAQMMEWVRPDGFIPVHGTLHHLKKHAELAREMGISDVVAVENGASVEVGRARPLALGSPFSHGAVRLAWGGEVMSSRVRRRRGEMARRGVVFISVVVDTHRELRGKVSLTVLGVPGVDDDEGALAVVESAIRSGVNKSRDVQMSSLEDGIRRAVRAVIQEMCGARPLVEVHVIKRDV
jgi:ribonuclease J